MSATFTEAGKPAAEQVHNAFGTIADRRSVVAVAFNITYKGTGSELTG